jgi:hypothetical protein
MNQVGLQNILLTVTFSQVVLTVCYYNCVYTVHQVTERGSQLNKLVNPIYNREISI